MKTKLRQLTALLLTMSICLSLLSANVWAVELLSQNGETSVETVESSEDYSASEQSIEVDESNPSEENTGDTPEEEIGDAPESEPQDEEGDTSGSGPQDEAEDTSEPIWEDEEEDTSEPGLQEKAKDKSEPASEDESDSEETDDDQGAPDGTESSPTKILKNDQNWEYYLSEDDCVIIAGFSKTTVQQLTVPRQINGHLVIGIDDYAFENLINLKRINIPFYVTQIGKDAFGSTKPIIEARFGSYALQYAEQNSLPMNNESEYDFADGVLDMAEIISSHYVVLDETNVRMNKKEASMLRKGCVFYLPPSEYLPNGDALKVLNMEQASGDQVLLRCERALGADAVKSIHVQEKKILPDWEKAVFYYDSDSNGTFERYDYETVQTMGIEISPSGSVSGSVNLKSTIDLYDKEKNLGELTGDDEQKIKTKVKVDYDLTIDLTAAVDVDMDLGWNGLKIDNFDVSISERAEGSITVSGKCSGQFPIAEVPLTSVGVATVYTQVAMDVSAGGTITYSISGSAKQGIAYDVESETMRPYHTEKIEPKVSGAIKIQGGLQFELGVNVMFLGDVVKFDLRIGLDATLTYSALRPENCLDINVKGVIRAWVSTDFSKLPGKIASKISIEITIIERKFPLFSAHYEKVDGSYQKLAKCSYSDTLFVKFDTLKDFDVDSQNVYPGQKLLQPKLTAEQIGNDELMGWRSEGETEFWNFENGVTKNMTLKAIWRSDIEASITYPLIFVAEGMTSFTVPYFAGASIDEPDTPMRKDFRFAGWYCDRELSVPADFSSLVMPNNSMTLYGKWEEAPGYDPWNISIITGTTPSPGTSIQEPYEVSIQDGYAVITKYKGTESVVHIPENINGYPVTSIANAAFSSNKSIKTVYLPSGLKIIGTHAFYYCDNLEAVHISGKNLKWIDFYAFAFCKKLSLIELPKSLIGIEDYAFQSCFSLKNLTLPNGVTSIAEGAFANSGLVSITFPGSLKTIGEEAFKYCPLVQVSIPSSVKDVSSKAFYGCAYLTNIDIQNGVEYINSSAFDESAWYQQQSDGLLCLSGYCLGYKGEIPENASLTLPSGISTVAVHAFSINNNLEEIDLKDCVTIQPCAFYYCTNLRRITGKNSVHSIGRYAFYGCSSLSGFETSDNLETIGDKAFAHCTGLTEIRIPSGFKSLGDTPFISCRNLTRFILDCGTFDDRYDLLYTNNDSHDVEIVFTEQVESIQLHLRNTDGSNHISQIIIGKNVRVISDDSLSNLTNVASIYYDAAQVHVERHDSTPLPSFFPKDIKQITIGSSVKCIPDYFANQCSELETLTFENESAIEYIGLNAFDETPWLQSMEADKQGVWRIGSCLFRYFGSLDDENIVIPNGIRMICSEAYKGLNWHSVTFSNSVEEIDDYAFSDSTFPSNNFDRTIDMSSSKISRIGRHAFEGSYVKNILFSDQLKRIEERAFAFCDCSVIMLPEGVEFLGNNAFYDNSSRPHYSLYFPKSLKEIQGGFGVGYWTQSTYIRYLYCCKNSFADEYLSRIGYQPYYVFDEYPALAMNEEQTHIQDLVMAPTTLRLPDSIVSMDDDALIYGCYTGTTVQCFSPKDINEIIVTNNKQWDFYFGNTYKTLKKLYIEANVSRISWPCLQKFEALEDLHLASTNSCFIEEDGFLMDKQRETLYKCNSRKSTIIIPEGVKEIAPLAFNYPGEVSISIPESIELIHPDAMKNCTPTIYGKTGSYAEYFANEKKYRFISTGTSTLEKYIAFGWGCSLILDPDEHIVYVRGDYSSNYNLRYCSVFWSDFWSEYNAKGDLLYITKNVRGLRDLAEELPGSHSFNTIEVDTDNSNVRLYEGGLYSNDYHTLYYLNPSITEYQIHRECTWIEHYAMREHSKLKKIDIPDSVSYIGEYAFSGTSLTEVKLPTSLGIIGSSAFRNTPLSKVVIGEKRSGVSLGINSDVFQGCKSLESIYIPPRTYWIHDDAFSQSGLKTVYGVSGTYAQQWALENGYLFNNDSSEKEGVYNGLTFVRDDKKATITGVATGHGTKITIPDSIDSVPVTEIDSGAFKGVSDVEEVVIPETICQIGNGAFSQMSSLRTITVSSQNPYFCTDNYGLYDANKETLYLYFSNSWNYYAPDSLKHILDEAFHSSNVERVYLNDGLLSIGKKAFFNCTRLKSVNLTESLEEIGDWAFWNDKKLMLTGPLTECIASRYADRYHLRYNLYTVTLMNGTQKVLSFENRAGRPLEMPSLDSALNSYTLSGWYQNQDLSQAWDFGIDTMPQSNLILFAGWTCDYLYEVKDDKITITGVCRQANYYTIPSGLDGKPVTRIKQGSFCDSSILSVRIPSSVEEIEDGAFADSVMLCVEKGSRAETYAKDAGVDYTLNYHKVEYITNGGTAVSSQSYATGELLVPVSEPIRDNYLFGGWYSDEALSNPWTFDTDPMPEGGLTLYARWIKVNNNIADLPFTFRSKAGAVTIVSYTGNKSAVEIPSQINGESVTAIDRMAFAGNTTIKSLIIPEGVTSIGAYAFNGCTCLRTVNLPGSVKRMGTGAFSNCSNLKELTVGDGITSFSEGCFSYCGKLTSVILPDSVSELNDSLFYCCENLSTVNIGSGLCSIGANAFGGCSSLEALNLPSGLETLDPTALSLCTSLNTITVSNGNTSYYSLDGVLFTADKTKLLCYPGGRSAQDYTVPADVKELASSSFQNAQLLQTLNLDQAVELDTIGASAFSGCTALERVDLSKTKVRKLPDNAFSYCNNLKTVILAQNHQSIGKYAFSSCNSLEQMIIPRSIENIGQSAFVNCPALTLYFDEDEELMQYAKDNGITYYYWPNKPGKPAATAQMRSIKVEITDGCEYSLDAVQWTSDNLFENLEPDTQYYVYQRVAKGDDHGVSDSSEALLIRTKSQILLSECHVQGDTQFSYTGKRQVPSIQVTYEGNELVENTDYTLDCPEETTDVGTYSVTVVGRGDYNGTASFEYQIIKAENEWVEEPTCEMSGFHCVPSGSAAFGEVKYSFSKQETGPFVETVPEAFGIWYMKAHVDGSDQYNELTKVIPIRLGEYPVMKEGENKVQVKNSTMYVASFVPQNSGTFRIFSTSSVDSYGQLYSSEKEVLVSDDDSGERYDFLMEVDLTEGTQYYIGTQTYSSLSSVELTITIENLSNPPLVHEYYEPAWQWANDNSAASAIFVSKDSDDTEIIQATVSLSYTPGTCRDKSRTIIIAKATFCGKEHTDQRIVEGEIDPNKHTGGEEIRNRKAATCGAAGYTGDAYCLGCSRKLASGQAIPATGNHTWDAGSVTRAATTTQEGVKTFTCTVCHATRTESIPKLNTPEPTSPPTSNPTQEPTPAPTQKKQENTITASNFVKSFSAKAQKFNLNASANGAPLNYTSSNSRKVSVNASGRVTIKKKFSGTVTITINAAETDTYNATTKTITITVPTVTNVKKATAGKGQVTVQWNKNKTGDAYEVQYSTDKKFKKSTKSVKAKKQKTVKTTIKKLKAGTYYVRIRTVKGKCASDWSKAKTVKVK